MRLIEVTEFLQVCHLIADGRSAQLNFLVLGQCPGTHRFRAADIILDNHAQNQLLSVRQHTSFTSSVSTQECRVLTFHHEDYQSIETVSMNASNTTFAIGHARSVKCSRPSVQASSPCDVSSRICLPNTFSIATPCRFRKAARDTPSASRSPSIM